MESTLSVFLSEPSETPAAAVERVFFGISFFFTVLRRLLGSSAAAAAAVRDVCFLDVSLRGGYRIPRRPPEGKLLAEFRSCFASASRGSLHMLSSVSLSAG